MSTDMAVTFSIPQLIRLHGQANVSSVEAARRYISVRESGADHETVQVARIASDDWASIVHRIAVALGYDRPESPGEDRFEAVPFAESEMRYGGATDDAAHRGRTSGGLRGGIVSCRGGRCSDHRGTRAPASDNSCYRKSCPYGWVSARGPSRPLILESRLGTMSERRVCGCPSRPRPVRAGSG